MLRIHPEVRISLSGSANEFVNRAPLVWLSECFIALIQKESMGLHPVRMAVLGESKFFVSLVLPISAAWIALVLAFLSRLKVVTVLLIK